MNGLREWNLGWIGNEVAVAPIIQRRTYANALARGIRMDASVSTILEETRKQKLVCYRLNFLLDFSWKFPPRIGRDTCF